MSQTSVPGPIDASASYPTSRLMVLCFTDIVGSTDLKNRLGTVEYTAELGRHDRIFQQIIAASPGARILKDTGDGFFTSFATASDAVRAALRFQHELNRLGTPIKTRIGIHVGEVAELDKEHTGLAKVVGLAADFAARLMGLAVGGQILLTRFAFNEARQFVLEHPRSPGDSSGALPQLVWVAHGEYALKGSDEPFEVFEVGGQGIAPLQAPPDGVSARRCVCPGDEVTLGWRPAAGLTLRDRPHWIIREKLGEGGFGEVWLAEHSKTRSLRVFKFCFEPERLRGLKREVVLFRLLKEALGDRRDIGRIIDYQFDEPPYFIETEHVPAGNLLAWAERQGGIASVPLQTRLQIVIGIADALAAAHSVGVLHKDIKPSNILIDSDAEGRVWPVLTDFGIGILTDRSQLAQRDITVVGFTQTALTENESSRTGTRLYAPPESLLDKPFTVQGDIYALGVLLYQMVIADLTRPLAGGWEREVPDELLREDIAACVEGTPERRLSSAAELARRLRELEDRRAELKRQRDAGVAAARRQRLVRVLAGLVLVIGIVAVALGITLRERTRRVQAELSRADSEKRQRAEAEEARDRIAAEAAKSAAALQFLQSMLTSADPAQTRGASLTVRDMLDRASERVEREGAGDPEVEMSVRAAIGNTYLSLSLLEPARRHLERAAELAEKTYGPGADLASRLCDLASLRDATGDHAESEQLFRKALDMQRKSLGAEAADTLTIEINLAGLLLNMGKYAEARELIEHALAVRRRTLGEEAPETLDALRGMTRYYSAMAEYDKAEPLLEQILKLREQKLGPDHPHTIMTLIELATLYHSSGKFDRAEPLFKRAIELSEKVSGAGHLETANYLNKLGLLYDGAGRFSEAEKAYGRALTIMESKLGPDHTSIASVLNNQAMLYVAMGRYADAAAPLARAVAICEKSLGPEHPDTASALNNLATLHDDLGDAGTAEPLYRRALEIRRKVLGAEHPAVCVCENNLGLLYLNQGRLAEAEPLLQHVVEVWTTANGADHPDTATATSNLALLYSKTNRLDESEKLHRQVLETRMKVLGEDHPHVALSLSSVAGLEDQRKQYDEADRDYAKAIAILVKAYGRTHRQVVQVSVNRAVALKHAAKLSQAAEVLDVAIESARQSQNGPGLVQGLFERADVARLAGQGELASQLTRQCRERAAELPDAVQRDKWTKLADQLLARIQAPPATTQAAMP